MTDRELAGCAKVMRYYHSADGISTMDPDDDGPWVAWTDYAALLAKHEALLSRAPSRDAEDAQAWRQWCESVGAEQIVALNEKFGGALGLVRDAERYRWIRANCDVIEAMDETLIGWTFRNNGCTKLDDRIDAWIKQSTTITAAEGETK